MWSLALLWSVYAQILGAFAYNIGDWNNKEGKNIDNPMYRNRLWSIKDSPIDFYSRDFKHARARKKSEINLWLSGPL